MPPRAEVAAAPVAFEVQRTVRFSHCDPAGIVFFPQYLVMLNDVVEAWFCERLGIDYAQLIGPRRIGMPTVRLECDFVAPGRMGEALTFSLGVERVGGASLALAHRCRLGEHDRFRARQVLVATSLDTHQAIPLPADLRAALQACTPKESAR